MPKTLQAAMAAIKAGDIDQSRRLLKLIVQSNPENEMAWLWLANIAETDEDSRESLNRVLAINPDNKWANRELTALRQPQPQRHPQILDQLSRLATTASAIRSPKARSDTSQIVLPKQNAPLRQSLLALQPPLPANGLAKKGETTVAIKADSSDSDITGDLPEQDTPTTQSGTYDAFISYSRKDRPFVQKLYETLQDNEKEVWVDWGNIPLTADWRAEIREGIEKANAVIFVVSPDFLASKECMAELDIAEEFSKRLIPMVYRDVDPDYVPQSLASLNWLFFRNTDNFESAYQALQDSLGTDLEWVKTHTRILVRAMEWDGENQNSSFLLHGDDLKEAELQVAEADKNPAPTPLQKQYILASREYAIKRQRTRMILVSIGFILSVVLAIFAYFQFRSAEAAQAKAELQAKISLSRQLAAQAIIYAEQQPDLAVLLSLEAEHLVNEASTSDRLLANLRYSPYLDTMLHGHTANVRSVAFSPDGTLLASGGKDQIIIIWDVATHQPHATPLAGHTDRITQVIFSPDGKTLASSSRDGTIRLWDMVTHKTIGQPLTGHIGRVNSIAFTPDGSQLASGAADGNIILWDIATQAAIGQPFSGHTAAINSIAISSDGKVLASGGLDNTVRLWDVASRRPLHRPLPGHNGWINSVAFSPDGRLVASGSVDRSIRLWDVASGSPHGVPFTGHPTAVTTLVFSPDGNRLASGSEDDSIILWDVESRQQLGWPLFGHANSVLSVAFSPDGKLLASGSSDGNIVLWDISVGQFLAGHSSVVRSVAFSPDGNTIVSAGSDHTLRLWDPVTKSQIGENMGTRISDTGQQIEGHAATVWSAAFSPDGQTIASGGGDGSVIMWDVASGSALGEPLKGHDGDVLAIAFSPTEPLLASGGGDRTIVLWNTGTSEIVRTFAGHTGNVTDIAFSPDGRLLASAGGDRSVRLWDVPTGNPIGDPLMGHEGEVNSVDFSADGKLLASGSHDTFIILWDVETQTEIAELQGHTNRVISVAFSPDGKTLASGSYDKNIILWDVDTRQPIGPPLIGHTNDVNSVAWSPDGAKLVSGSWDNNLIVWDINFDNWPARACQIANRNLSQEEWEEFVGTDHSYEIICTHQN